MKFAHKKSLGQNFLSDKNLLDAIVSDAKVGAGDAVLEIGAGMGALTQALAKKAKYVLAIETDQRLKTFLQEQFSGQDNVEFLFDDFMKVGFDQIQNVLGEKYIVVANLPYYITTPILFRFFEEQNGATKIVVMVQKEVADRMVARPGTKDYGILSVACQHMGTTRILRKVGRHNFDPVPNVDSAMVEVDLASKQDSKEFFAFSRACFAMRRKTLQNNLKGKVDSLALAQALSALKKPLDVRAEALSPQEIYALFLNLAKNNKK